jgi:hypothetical protein
MRGITRNQFFILAGMLVIVMAIFIIAVSKNDSSYTESSEVSNITYREGVKEENTEEESIVSTDNDPFNTMSADWGAELYESGFKYYQIPQEYIDKGGYFPEVVQAYLWCMCEERGLNYYMIVALIEKESGYKYDMLGDNGNSIGYMQIYQKWHEERMDAEGVTDLFNPYGNIRVGTNYLQEIYEKYGSSGDNCVLMVYNMGEQGAKKYWKQDIYSTEYSRAILQRAQEIEQELQD